ncbi:MAG TPA: histidine kinase, partial [Gemmatimonadaceae bacterium]|nr:histidine kinase [Gemmatimonadaceae bacterium]
MLLACLPSSLRALLRVPLAGKLAGANLLIIAAGFAAIAAALPEHVGAAGTGAALLLLAGALLAALLADLGLVRLALRPVRELEAVAERVWRGDLRARVPSSPLADRDVARVGGMFNLLLDKLTADGTRMRRLATEVIQATDGERARIAHELHDSTAQSLAALVLQLSAAARDNRDAALATRLETMKELAGGVLEDVRLLAHTVHPRVLDDLGLPAALRALAREARARCGGVVIDVAADTEERWLPAPVAATLYRVAQEGMTNALHHAAPRAIHVRLVVDARDARLELADDGAGFDTVQAE